MKISNSKKQLAKIISENGGWRDGAEWATQDRVVAFFSGGKPRYEAYDKTWYANGEDGVFIVAIIADCKIKSFHNTILSREEYFHLYPAPDADGWIEWGGGECPVEEGVLVDVKWRTGTLGGIRCDELMSWAHTGRDHDIIAYRLHKQEHPDDIEPTDPSEPEPTIEQLAADYRAKLAIAQQAQEEADSHRCGAEAALEKLVAAGKALGLVLSVAAPEPEKPTKPYTGKFYKEGLDREITYSREDYDIICDGCGRRFGAHTGLSCGGGPNA